MGIYHVFALSLIAVTTQAWFFSDRVQTGTSEGRAVDEECLAKADSGECGFYECFETRLPCGREGYMYRQGQYYCNKMESERHRFSEDGQRFLDDAKKCMMQKLKTHYQQEYVDCHDLEHAAIESISTCFADNAFCTAFRVDHENFWRIYQFSDLFRRGAGKIWREVVSLTTQCTTEYLRDFSSEAGRTIVDGVNDLVENLSDTASEHGRQAIDGFNEAIENMDEHRENLANSVNDLIDTVGDAARGLGDSSEETE